MRRALLPLIACSPSSPLAAPVAAQSGPSATPSRPTEALEPKRRPWPTGAGVRTGRELTSRSLRLARSATTLSRSDQRRRPTSCSRARPTRRHRAAGGPYSHERARDAQLLDALLRALGRLDRRRAAADATPTAAPTPDYVDTVIDGARAVLRRRERRARLAAAGVRRRRGGDALTDVYLKELNSDPDGLYGYAATETGSSGRSRSAYLVLDERLRRRPEFAELRRRPARARCR